MIRCLAANVLVAAFLASTPTASAQIYVDFLAGSPDAWINLATYSAGSDVTIDDTGSWTYRVYTASYTTENIGTISLNSQANGTPTLFVGRGRTVPSEMDALLVPGCLDLAGITWSGGKPRLQAYVYHDVTGDISMWHVVRIDVDGYLMGDVYHDGGGGVTPAPRLGFVGYTRAHHLDGTNYTPIEIVAAHGDIHRVEGLEENHANVISSEGSIDEVEGLGYGAWHGNVLARNGSIGSVINNGQAIDLVRLQGYARIEARNGIGTVRIVGGGADILADIKANVNGGAGNLVLRPYSSDG